MKAAQQIHFAEIPTRNYAYHKSLEPSKLDFSNVSYLSNAPIFVEISQQSYSEDGISHDLLNDSFDLVNDPIKTDVAYYPLTKMTSSSLMKLQKKPDENKNELLELIANSCREMNRSGSDSATVLKLTFISDSSSTAGTPKSIEFLREADYWAAIVAIKRFSLGEDVRIRGRCNNPSSNENGHAANGNSFLQRLNHSYQATTSNSLSSSLSHDDCTFEIENNAIRVVRKNVEVLSINLSAVQAVVLSSDYEEIRPFFLEIAMNLPNQLDNNNNNTNTNVNNNNNKNNNSKSTDSSGTTSQELVMKAVVVNGASQVLAGGDNYENVVKIAKSVTQGDEALMVPISEEDVYRNRAFGGIQKIALVNVNKNTGSSNGCF